MALRRMLVLLCSSALLVTACGGDDEAGPASTTAPAQRPTAAAVQPTTPPPPKPTPTRKSKPQRQGQRTYRIRAGDTLSSIAERFDTTVRALVRENGIADPDLIKPGRRLRIP